jgi:excisionase family DNA binding protein
MNRKTGVEAGDPRLLGREQAATYLGVTTRSIHRLVARGLLSPVRIHGVRRTLFDRSDLDELVAAAKQLPVGVGECE